MVACRPAAAGAVGNSRGEVLVSQWAAYPETTVTTPVNGMGPVLENIEARLAFQKSLEEQGIMFAAGPQWTDDEKSWEGDGMVVIRANSLAEARAIPEKDPMHAGGARKFTVRPWFVNEGTVTIKLDYSQRRFEVQ
jgi:hypothetical protein